MLLHAFVQEAFRTIYGLRRGPSVAPSLVSGKLMRGGMVQSEHEVREACVVRGAKPVEPWPIPPLEPRLVEERFAF